MCCCTHLDSHCDVVLSFSVGGDVQLGDAVRDGAGHLVDAGGYTVKAWLQRPYEFAEALEDARS